MSGVIFAISVMVRRFILIAAGFIMRMAAGHILSGMIVCDKAFFLQLEYAQRDKEEQYDAC